MEIIDETPRTGGCQCGAVRFEATAILDNAHVCHCRMCQRATGNFFQPLVGVPLDRLAWTAGEPATFRSSEQVDRGFCRDCGTPLFYRYLPGGHVSLNIGTFDDPDAEPLLIREECGLEARLAQIDRLGSLPTTRTEEDMPEEAARIRASSNQWRPEV